MKSLSSLLTLALTSPLSAAATWTYPIAADNSYFYDLGLYGAFPQQSLKSLTWPAPWVNRLKHSSKCNNDYTFLEPRGDSVPHEGPVILDNKGNLIWMEPKWGQAMDVKVQRYQGEDYITFWHGEDNGLFGRGYYLMIDSSYNVFKNITTVGNQMGDLNEFRITKDGTALMTMYEARQVDLSAFGVQDGWIYDSLFQEVDIETGRLVFQWRASDHFPFAASRTPLDSRGDGSPERPWDFYHINSVDKDDAGNYLVSSRHMHSVSCLSGDNGEVLWQLGGEGNTFKDLSNGAATNFSWQHHASWHRDARDTSNTLKLTVFDNGAYSHLATADHSRGLLIGVDLAKKTATLIQDFVAPERFLVGSQGSVQYLPKSETILVGWGHTPAYTEYSMDGEVLCDTHFGATSVATLGWAKSYRTLKFPWVGRPQTLPDVAMKPRLKALYVSWNGATEVDRWVLQSAPKESIKKKHFDFTDISTSKKLAFETRIKVSPTLGQYVRVAALDKNGNILAYSGIVNRGTGKYVSGKPVPEPESIGIQKMQWIYIGSVFGYFGSVVLVAWMIRTKGAPLRTARREGGKLFHKITGRGASYEYNPLTQGDNSELANLQKQNGAHRETV